MTEHEHAAASDGEGAASPDFFHPAGWEERYSRPEQVWSGQPNPQLVTEVTALVSGGAAPGTALDVGCGEGGDVVWLARNGWRTTGADFSPAGLRRTLLHAEQAGVADRVEVWETDARAFDADGRTWDLVTSHFLHPPAGGMVEVTRRLATAVAPGGHLLVVGHAPSHAFAHGEEHAAALFLASDLVGALPDDFTPVVVEQRPRTVTRDGVAVEIDDSTLLARRGRRHGVRPGVSRGASPGVGRVPWRGTRQPPNLAA